MLNYNELKPGEYIVIDGQPYVVLEFNFFENAAEKAGGSDKNKKSYYRENN